MSCCIGCRTARRRWSCSSGCVIDDDGVGKLLGT